MKIWPINVTQKIHFTPAVLNNKLSLYFFPSYHNNHNEHDISTRRLPKKRHFQIPAF